MRSVSVKLTAGSSNGSEPGSKSGASERSRRYLSMSGSEFGFQLMSISPSAVPVTATSPVGGAGGRSSGYDEAEKLGALVLAPASTAKTL